MTFQHLNQDLDDHELRELEQFLAAPGLEETSMDLYGIDGFFAAILANPRTLVPSEWMPWIWDADRGKIAPEFENLDEAQRILSLLMRHYNTVARLLMAESDRFVPLYEPGDSAAASAWCVGFLTGTRFDPEAWDGLLEGKPKWFAPILGLGSKSDDPAATDARRRARWTREVGASVAKIHAFWLEARRAQSPGVTADTFAAGSGPPSARASQRTGRNDPCPCGSGRKFKRCCGASPAGLN